MSSSDKNTTEKPFSRTVLIRAEETVQHERKVTFTSEEDWRIFCRQMKLADPSMAGDFMDVGRSLTMQDGEWTSYEVYDVSEKTGRPRTYPRFVHCHES